MSVFVTWLVAFFHSISVWATLDGTLVDELLYASPMDGTLVSEPLFYEWPVALYQDGTTSVLYICDGSAEISEVPCG